MTAALFNDEQKVRIRHHLGYLNVAESQTFVLGVPAGVETQFMIEGAMNRVLEAALPKALELLTRLDNIEAQMGDDLELLAVNQIGSIQVRQTEMKELRKEYRFWRQALANVLGTYPNPFDRRWEEEGAINVPVVH